MAKMILTTHEGNQSNTIVLNSTLTVNRTINEAIAKIIPNTPDMIEPDASELNLQHELKIGPAIFVVWIYLKQNKH